MIHHTESAASEGCRLQVQVATMNQEDLSLLDRMNIQCDALIGNQSMAENRVQSGERLGYRYTMYSWQEKGVGLNRNNLLMRSNAEIILFADDDVVYDDGYVQTILNAFDRHPEADGITFDVIPIPDTIDPCRNRKWHRIRRYNCLRYGAPRLALRGKALRETNVCFSTQFGGGAKYASGEDSLFIMRLLRAGLRLYACPERIGTVTFTTTWFTGYNEQYFRDKGVFFYVLSHRFARALCLQYCIRRSGLFAEACTRREAYTLMLDGIRQYMEER